MHNSFECPLWLERVLAYFGVQVGLAGPLGLLRQHDLRDFAQRLPVCHDYLRHGRGPLADAWWQLNCELTLDRPPEIRLEPRIAADRYLAFLERTWMLRDCRRPCCCTRSAAGRLCSMASARASRRPSSVTG